MRRLIGLFLACLAGGGLRQRLGRRRRRGRRTGGGGSGGGGRRRRRRRRQRRRGRHRRRRAAGFPSTSTIYQDISGAAVDSESTAIMGALQTSGVGRARAHRRVVRRPHADASVARRAFTAGGERDPTATRRRSRCRRAGTSRAKPNYHCAAAATATCSSIRARGSTSSIRRDITGGMATGGTFTGGCVVVWDLTQDYWASRSTVGATFARGDSCNGADAGDLPMARAASSDADEIRPADQPRDALHHAERRDPQERLRPPGDAPRRPDRRGADVAAVRRAPAPARRRSTISKLPSDAARTVARALQKYGMFLADGGNLFISAPPTASAA